MDYVHHYDSPLGGITIASDGVALVGLWFDGQKHLPDPFVPGALAEGSAESDPSVSAQTDAWLDTYFAGSDPGPTPPLAPRGTALRADAASGTSARRPSGEPWGTIPSRSSSPATASWVRTAA